VPVVQQAPPELPQGEHFPFEPHWKPERHCIPVQQASPLPPQLLVGFWQTFPVQLRPAQQSPALMHAEPAPAQH
jgi:hypothetical protein